MSSPHAAAETRHWVLLMSLCSVDHRLLRVVLAQGSQMAILWQTIVASAFPQVQKRQINRDHK